MVQARTGYGLPALSYLAALRIDTNLRLNLQYLPEAVLTVGIDGEAKDLNRGV